MSINFAGIPVAQYIGAPYAIPMQVGRAGQYCVPLSLNWISYGASDTFQNISVSVNLAGTSNQPRQLLQQIKSLYIDNSGSPVPIYVQFSDTLFTVIAQPYSAGWYPVFTNAFQFNIIGLGFTTNQRVSTKIFVTNAIVSPYTDTALQTVLPYYLSSPALGGGSSLATITPVLPGQSYAHGGLSITGGGGNGATAHGILDQFGRFIQVIIDTPGNSYTGVPVIVPTAANNAPAAYNQGTNYAPNTHVTYQGIEYIWQGTLTIQTGAAAWNTFIAYAAGVQVNYQSNIYQTTQNLPPEPMGTMYKPPNDPVWAGVWVLVGGVIPTGTNWLSSGTAPATVATFTATLTAVSRPIVSSGLASPVLGDQAQNVIDQSATSAINGTFRNNLWGTPYNTGFIYLKSINVKCLAIGPGTFAWKLTNTLGYTPYSFEAFNGIGATYLQGIDLLNLQDMNQKLDATQTWSLVETVNTVTNTFTLILSHGWAWTYALI